MNDWRLMGQEKYLQGVKLKIVSPSKFALTHNKDKFWHEHCEFCMDNIDESSAEECYTTTDYYRWICKDCFNDFQSLFNWDIEAK